MRTKKCDWCKISDRPRNELIEYLRFGKKKAEVFHDHCIERVKTDDVFREQERNELDELSLLLQDIYNTTILPSFVFTSVQEIRNGEINYGRRQKKYKQGFKYSIITETYRRNRSSIEYWRTRKNFDGLRQEFRYGLAIIADQINQVEKQLISESEQKRKAELSMMNHEETEEQLEEFISIERKTKKPKQDVNSFLD